MAPKSRKKKAHDKTPLTCHCHGMCPNNDQPGTCQTRPGGKCFSISNQYLDEENNVWVKELMYGCMSPDDNGGMFQCKTGQTSFGMPNIICCDSGDLCNKDVVPPDHPTDANPPAADAVTTAAPALSATEIPLFALLTSIIVCSGVFIVIVAALYLIYRRRERSHSGAKHLATVASSSPRACLIDSMMRGGGGSGSGSSSAGPAGHLADLVELSSGSGSGLPLLVQRTIVKEIEFKQLIGQGRYGKVYLAKFRGENVAAKVFNPAAEASWFREAEIYQSVMMRHENVMGFIAADIDGSGQRMLITHYHELGSVQDYLQTHVLSPVRLLELAHSLAAGLAHLHTEIFGSSGKPAIAHGDLNTKTVLVKKDGRCAIGDFGLAVKYLSDSDDIQRAKNPRAPSVRYQAPEQLARTLVADKFESYKACDMYACGLVLWEMARCCATPVRGSSKKTLCDDYALPYQDVLLGPAEARPDEMRRLVVDGGVRPPLPQRWEDDAVLRQMRGLMADCWKANPASRLTALRVKKSLSKMLTAAAAGCAVNDPSIRMV